MLVDEQQSRAERSEGRVGLALVELGLGQLHVAGADVVGDDQGCDVVAEGGGGDVGVEGQRGAEDEPEFDFVVEQADVSGPDDFLGRARYGSGGLAEEGRGHEVGIEAGVDGVGAAVDHLGNDAAGRGHRRQQLARSEVFPAVVGPFGLFDGRPVGEEIGGGGGVGADRVDPAIGALNPPALTRTDNGCAHGILLLGVSGGVRKPAHAARRGVAALRGLPPHALTDESITLECLICQRHVSGRCGPTAIGPDTYALRGSRSRGKRRRALPCSRSVRTAGSRASTSGRARPSTAQSGVKGKSLP